MSIWLRNKSWQFDFIVHGKRYRGHIGNVSRSVAREFASKKRIAALEGRLVSRALKAPLFGRYDAEKNEFSEAAKDYLDYYQKNHKPSSYRRMFVAMKTLCGFFGDRRLDVIDPFSIERYKGQRKAAGKANATVNRELACLKNLFNMGRRWNWVRENPVREVKMFDEDNGRDRWLSLAEDSELLKHCVPKLRVLVIAAVDTGFRAGELQSLRWQDVDFARGYIAVASSYTKNGDARVNHMTKRLTDALREWQLATDGKGGQPVFGAYRYREPFEKARKAASLGEDVLFHSLRHTYITRLMQGGVNVRTVQESAGHKTIAMTMRYAHHSPEQKRHAASCLDKFLAGEVPTESTAGTDNITGQLTSTCAS